MGLDHDLHDLIDLHHGLYDMMDLDHDLYGIMDLGHDLPEVVNKNSRNDRIVVRVQRVLYGCAFFVCVCTINLPLLLQATPSSTHCSVRRRDASSCERESCTSAGRTDPSSYIESCSLSVHTNPASYIESCSL